jgi:hypothetical protein
VITRARAWWRRRRRQIFDWEIECPELITPGGHLRHVSTSRYVRGQPYRDTPGILEL